MSKHTPGPWKRADKLGWSGIEKPGGEDLLLYATCGMKPGDWHGRIVFDNPADEAVVLTAPALLDALTAALLHMRNYTSLVDSDAAHKSAAEVVKLGYAAIAAAAEGAANV